MAYGNYGNRNYGNSNYQSRGGYQSQAPQPVKEPFNLDRFVDELIDVYVAFASKLEERGITLPEDTIARWATSAKISMDK